MGNNKEFNRLSAIESISMHTGIKQEGIKSLHISDDILEDYQTVLNHCAPEVKIFRNISMVFTVAAIGSAIAAVAQPYSQELFQTPQYPDLAVGGTYIAIFGTTVFACLMGWNTYNLKAEVSRIREVLLDGINSRGKMSGTESPQSSVVFQYADGGRRDHGKGGRLGHLTNF